MKLSTHSFTVPFVLAVSAVALGGCSNAMEPTAETSAAATIATPVLTSTTALLPTKLAATRSEGVTSIRLTRVSGDLHLEEINAGGEAVIGFALHPVMGVTGKVATVSITRLGSTAGIILASGGATKVSTLATAERAALATIGNELSGYGEGADSGVKVMPLDWLGWIGAGIACGLAAVEGGANPLADAACAIDTGEAMADSEKEEEGK